MLQYTLPIESAAAIALGRWLHARPWDWWCTLTFKRSPTPERAVRTFRRWIKKLNRQRFGSKYWKRNQGICWARVLEYQGSGHFHALLADCSSLSREAALADWKHIAGDARIDPYNPKRGAAFYLAQERPAARRSEFDLELP